MGRPALQQTAPTGPVEKTRGQIGVPRYPLMTGKGRDVQTSSSRSAAFRKRLARELAGRRALKRRRAPKSPRSVRRWRGLRAHSALTGHPPAGEA
jgi:hypothetical protein